MAKDGNRAISCYLTATEVAYIDEICEERGIARYGFVKEAVREHIARTSEARDMRQALDNLVEDPNCDYYLGTRNDNGQVQIVNRHTQVGLWFNDDAAAADHILGEESQGTH